MSHIVAESTPPYSPWSDSLVQWYDRGHRDLPWRHTRDPWAILISEIMAQQTRVEVVVPYYLKFLQRFPGYDSMAAAPVDEVLALWSGLGYYRRARSLHACSVELARRGGFPESTEELLKLPGIGAYTAAALTSIAWNRPAVALDGNAFRVYSRLFAIDTDIQSAANARALRQQTEEHIPPGRSGDYNQAVMELGATICLPRNPRCQLCPLNQSCLARQQSRQEDYPVLRRSKPKQLVLLEALVLRQGRQVWLTREHNLEFLEDLWLPLLGPPGSLGLTGEPLGSVRHGITFRDITIQVHLQHGYQPPSGGMWIDCDQLARFAIPNLTRKILRLAAIPTNQLPTGGAGSHLGGRLDLNH